jgi:prepilin-type N-terminal cleavage/methylation domain-containing protein
MKDKGFSLIELMVALAIIGILAAIAIPSYLGVQKRSSRTEARTNLETIRLLEEQFFAENNAFVAGNFMADGSDITLQAAGALPAFQPGTPGPNSALKYDYIVALVPGGFTATARPRVDRVTNVTNDFDFNIDNTNNRTATPNGTGPAGAVQFTW